MPNRDKIEVGITGGMRQDLSSHNAPPGTITDALNVRFSAVGEVESRPGTDALDFSTDCDVTYAEVVPASDVATLARLPGGFFVGAQGFGFRYDFDTSRLHAGASYGNAEPLGIFDVITREEIQVSGTLLSPYPLSQAAVNGYVATVHSSGNGQNSYGPEGGTATVLVHVFTESGTLVASLRTDNTTAAWVVADGSSSTNMVLITQDTTTGLSARIITTSATGATFGSPSSVGTLTAATAFWAAANWPGIGWALLYQSGAGTATISKLTGVTSSATQTFAVTGTVPLNVYCNATRLYAGWSEGGGPSAANARVYDTALTLTSGATIALGTDAGANNFTAPLFGPAVTASSSAMFAFAYTPSALVSDTSISYVGIMTEAGAISISDSVYQCVPASAPFGNGYLWVRAGGINNNTSYSFHRDILLDFMGLRAGDVTTAWDPVIALVNPLFIGGSSAAYSAGWYQQQIAAPAQLDDDSWVMGIPRIVREEDKLGAAGMGLAIAEWRQFKTGGARQVTRAGLDVISAGHPCLLRADAGTRYYNSTPLAEAMRNGTDLGFPLPMAVNTSTSNGSGSLVAGVYQLRLVLERIDSVGRRWRSSPSDTIPVNIGGADDTITVTGRANTSWLRTGRPRITSSQVVMHVYRTTANGSTFYRATPPQGAPVSVGDTGVFGFTDGISDSVLQLREILYTDGGVLGNDCPPSCRFVACSEDRVWLAGLWETEQLQSSKILVPGEPPQFSDSPAFRVVLPEPCTGIAVQDGVLIAFSKNAIYAVQGSGPNDQGQGAWDSPRCITNSTGCTSSPSILATSVGIFFQSGQGIELLPRGMGEPVFVGMPVQDLMYSTTLGRVALVTSSAVITTFRGRTARFVIDDGSATGLTLVYDLDTQAWSRDNHRAVITAIADTDDGAVMVTESLSGNYGALLEQLDEDQDSVGNSPTEISSSLEWAELRPFGVAGQGRFTGAVALFDAKSDPSDGYRAGNATIKLSVDRFSETGLVFNMNTLSGADYRKNTAANDVGTAGLLSLTTTVGGWRFIGWSVEIDDRGGGRRMGETEQG